MEIPIMKKHVDNAIENFNDKWLTLLLEESRDLQNLQNCQESIHDISNTLRTLSLALQRQIRGRL